MLDSKAFSIVISASENGGIEKSRISLISKCYDKFITSIRDSLNTDCNASKAISDSLRKVILDIPTLEANG